MTKEEKAALAEKNKQILADWKAEKDAQKQAKKEKRALHKARLKARPFWRKLVSVCVKVIAVLAVLGIVGAACFIPVLNLVFTPYLADRYYAAGYEEKDLEDVRALIPADTEAQQTIGAMEGYGTDDTWAFYIYVIGSNLESYGQNDLSEWVLYNASQEKADVRSAASEKHSEELQVYSDALEAAGLEAPGPLYYEDPPQEASSTVVTQDIVKADRTGAATMDLDEILAATLPENIEIVLETGGATHWTNALINPNRVQTLVYNSEGFSEERNVPAHSMTTVDSLTDFLQYCETNHAADHKVLILWDHGSGAFGYGSDEIYGGSLTLADIQQALSNVYTANVSDPAFELIGFDACLMASAEVMHTLDGYGRYFAGSEETEPGFGWYYTEWLEALAENPGMNGAQLGLAIADSYIDFYARIGLDTFGSLFGTDKEVTFSIIDIHKGAQVYDAYADLMEAILEQASGDSSLLAGVSNAADSAIHYCGSSSYIFNTIDIGTFMKNMPEAVSTEAAKVSAALADAVLYTRSGCNLEGSTGLSVYFPDCTTDTYSVLYLMKYLTEVSNNDAVNALYFYKSAGCLTEDMQQYLADNDIEEPAVLDLAALKAVASAPVVIDADGGFTAAVSAEARDMMTGIGLEIGLMDGDNIVYYGTDSDARLNENGELETDFAGQWILLEGQPLSVEVVYNSDSTITYHSPILLNGSKATLVFSYDKSEGKFSITGAYEASDAIEGDMIGRNISDLQPYSKIQPVYRCADQKTMEETTTTGKSIIYSAGTDITMGSLPAGDYLGMITFESIRGDEFYTGIVEFTMAGGKVSKMEVSSDYAVILG